MEEKILRATHQGVLRIGAKNIDCAVLEDGTRVITQTSFLRALERSIRPTAKQGASFEGMPAFLAPNNLKPFISQEIIDSKDPIIFKPLKGSGYKGKAFGYKAELLPEVCYVYMDAQKANALLDTQKRMVVAAEIIIRGLATVGIIALIDEATGYQEVRDRLALQKILDKYLLKEYAKWAKRFPDEFYELMFKLRGWQWKGMQINRPSVVGKYTNDLVYERLAPGILVELKRLNPPDEQGQRKSKHHQWLTEDLGHPALQKHINMLIGFERASANWGMFYRMVQRALPKMNEQIPLALEE